MNITFGKNFVKAKNDGKVLLQFSLEQLRDDQENNYLFRLLEFCVRSEEMVFEIDENAEPYIAKLYDILRDEFNLQDYDV